MNLSGTISPFNAWLIMRGSVTLPLRMLRYNENVLTVARWLESRPGHKVARRQMPPDFGSVLSLGLLPGRGR